MENLERSYLVTLLKYLVIIFSLYPLLVHLLPIMLVCDLPTLDVFATLTIEESKHGKENVESTAKSQLNLRVRTSSSFVVSFFFMYEINSHC